MEKRWFGGLVAMSILVASCTPTSAPPGTVDGPTDPLSVQEEWDRLGITDYRIVYSIHNLNGMGGSPGDGLFSVVVQDGKVTECEYEPSPSSGSNGCSVLLQAGPSPTPVGILFARLASWEPAFTIVEYDPELPLPVRIDYDEPGFADEEYKIRVIEFEVVGG